MSSRCQAVGGDVAFADGDGWSLRNYNAFVVPLDLRVQYRWSNNITLFAALDNIQDLPTAGGINRRSYRGGIRWNY